MSNCSSMRPEKDGDNSAERKARSCSVPPALSPSLRNPGKGADGFRLYFLLSSCPSPDTVWPLHTSPAGNTLTKVLNASPLPAQPSSSGLIFPPRQSRHASDLLFSETLHLDWCTALHRGLSPLALSLAPSSVSPLDVAMAGPRSISHQHILTGKLIYSHRFRVVCPSPYH